MIRTTGGRDVRSEAEGARMGAIDGLPPEARFLLRALHAGLSLEQSGALLALDAPETARRLRAALVRAGRTAPAAADPDALLSSAADLVAAAGEPPARAPSTPCLSDGVAASLGRVELAGPLLLAAAEHVADCPSCLARALALRAAAPQDRDAVAPRRPRGARGAVVALLVLAALVALVFVCG
jgi:hypothetical protein